MWNAQLEIAPDRTEAPTLYGLGDSLAAWATGVLNTVGNGPLIVVGASMGGSCALEMARQRNDRIAAIVLVGAKAGHRPEPSLRDAYINALEKYELPGLWPEIVAQCFGPRTPQSVIDHIESIALDQKTDDLIRAMRVFHGRPDLTNVASQWKKSLVAICGDSCWLESEKKTTALKAELPSDTQLHVMRGCGHYMSMERPTEFNAIIADFLRSVDARLCAQTKGLR